MHTTKICDVCNATVGADQDNMREAMAQHREFHIEEWKKEIAALEEKISELEKHPED